VAGALEEDCMTHRIGALLACAGCALLLTSCGSDEVAGPHRNAHQGREPGDTTAGGLNLFGGGGKTGPQDQTEGLAVNAYLWRGALETLKFMPLASADPFGGVIITDWWTPPAAAGERFKATAYVVSRQLRTDGIRVSLFRQVQQNGQWVDASVDPSKPTELENMVLAKARELRSQAGTAP
jgi:hypothetical protein